MMRQEVTFEGQAANIGLEMVAAEDFTDEYPFEIEAGDPERIDMRPMIRGIVDDLFHSRGAALIAARFHNTVAKIIAEVSLRIRKGDGLNRVCLSGGTFQNHFLLKRAGAQLRAHGFEVFRHSAVPPNDGGVSLGASGHC